MDTKLDMIPTPKLIFRIHTRGTQHQPSPHSPEDNFASIVALQNYYTTLHFNNGTYLDRVELHTSLDNIDGCQSSVGDGAADTPCGGSLQVVHEIIVHSGSR
jgi:hypothetical protein